VSRTLSIRTAVSAGLVSLFAVALITAYAPADARRRGETADATTLLGTQVPGLTLHSVDGTAIPLLDRLSHGPSLIIVLGSKDCFSCSSYQLELRILKSALPGLTPILIGSGGEEQVFRDYFRQDHLESVALLDTDRALLNALGVTPGPLVILTDAEGRILFVDHRSSSAGAQFPIGRILPLLGGALRSVPSSAPNSGDSK
jgi:hypothetical protein